MWCIITWKIVILMVTPNLTRVLGGTETKLSEESSLFLNFKIKNNSLWFTRNSSSISVTNARGSWVPWGARCTPVLLWSVPYRHTVQSLCRQQHHLGGQTPSRHSSASASKRQYQIPEISIRQCPQGLQNVSQEPKETGTILGSGQLLQRIGANVILKNSTTGRTFKANSTWGIESKCQMAASLLCALGNVVLNRFWEHPNLRSMKHKKGLWGYSTTGELGRDTLSTILEQGELVLSSHFRFFSDLVSLVD